MRSPDELATLVAHRGFTPRAGEAPALVALLAGADETLRRSLTRALTLVPAAAAAAIAAALPGAGRPLRGQLVELAGKLGEADPLAAGSLRPLLLGLLRDDDLKARLNAVTALGRLAPDERSEAELVALLAEAPRRELRLALIRSLGKIGGAPARAALEALTPAVADDQPAKQALERARLILGREATRDETSVVDGDVVVAAPVRVWLHTRRGLAGLLVDEAKAAGFANARAVQPGVVELWTPGPLNALWQLRLFDRMGLPLAVEPREGDGVQGDAGEAALAALTSPATTELLHALTRGLIRFRIDGSGGDAARWDLVRALAEAAPTLVNDPTASTWEVRVLGRPDAAVELVPKRLSDPRFTYREGFVFAASHPTLAAALARVAAPLAGDRVWDPFVGSGTELAEVARSARVAGLWGTDVDPRAVATARGNLAAAGIDVPVTLTVGDALTFRGVRPTLIISNPPMGRRVHRGTLGPLIDGVTVHAAEQLAPGGRLVWLSPLPARTAALLERCGLELTLRREVDMGGFTAELQRADKP